MQYAKSRPHTFISIKRFRHNTLHKRAYAAVFGKRGNFFFARVRISKQTSLHLYKSKLVEGDMLKLTITENGAFLYKQIGPIDRRHAIAVVTQDENGNYYVLADGKPYRVLLASITYFKATPGDEVAIVTPRGLEATWAAIENVIQKGAHQDWQAALAKAAKENEGIHSWKQELRDTSPNKDTPSKPDDVITKSDTVTMDSWMHDMEEIEKEIKQTS